MHWIAVFIFAVGGDLAGLGLPLPAAHKLHTGEFEIEGVADGFDLTKRIKSISLGHLLGCRWDLACSGCCRHGQCDHRASEKTYPFGAILICHKMSLLRQLNYSI